MFNRREIFKAGSTIGFGAFGGALGLVRMANAQPANTQLAAVFDKGYKDLLTLSPMLCTSLGVDKGEYSFQKFKLDHQNQNSRDNAKKYIKNTLSALNSVDRAQLVGNDRINYDAVVWDFKNNLNAINKFKGTAGIGAPYAISQLTGYYQQIPDFLDNQHTIESKEDAEAYISRLNEFAKVLNEECENAKADAAIGIIPPDFIIRRALGQLRGMVGTKQANQNLINSIVRRTKEKSINGNWEGRAAKIVMGEIRGGLQKQIKTLEGLLPKSSHSAGIWRIPNGPELYDYAIKTGTTKAMTADEVHKLGLEKVAEISAKIDVILKKQGLTEGTTGQRMAALYKDPKQVYPNNDTAKEELLVYLNTLVDGVYKRVPEYFNVLPKAKCDIRRVPKEIEAGAPGGYYNAPSLDGTRPGAYYINLRDTAEQPKWLLPTLTYHEAVPGHHFQIAIQQEAPLPMLRKLSGFNAYIEGWALYSEELANEMGLYENDPIGQVGYLHDAMFRAVRLVVDSGMHAKRWSRERAIKYMADNTGDAVSAATTEIERYCVWPGQALGYMVGKIQWLRLRAMMQAHMGDKFSFKDFHDTGLLAGAVPLEVLEQVYREKSFIA